MNMYIPVLVVVLANTLYHICAKSTPSALNPFASLTVTYAVGGVISLILFFVTRKDGGLLAEFQHLNWASFMLGLSIVGLEAGYLWMYKAGWEVSIGQTVQSAFLAVVLVILGGLVYKEAITVQRVAGVAICLLGLYLLK